MKAFAADTRLLANLHFDNNQIGALKYLEKAPKGARIERTKPGMPKLVKTPNGEIHGYIFKGMYTTMDEWAKDRPDKLGSLDRIMKDLGVKQ